MTDTAAIDAFLNAHQMDDANVRQLVSVTWQAIKDLDSRLGDAGLTPHTRGNFWQLLLLLRDPAA